MDWKGGVPFMQQQWEVSSCNFSRNATFPGESYGGRAIYYDTILVLDWVYTTRILVLLQICVPRKTFVGNLFPAYFKSVTNFLWIFQQKNPQVTFLQKFWQVIPQENLQLNLQETNSTSKFAGKLPANSKIHR